MCYWKMLHLLVTGTLQYCTLHQAASTHSTVDYFPITASPRTIYTFINGLQKCVFQYFFPDTLKQKAYTFKIKYNNELKPN